jgi:chemotaxis protein methyltransferase CheR
MMRPAISDRSSLFLLRGMQATADPAGDYFMQATGTKPGRPLSSLSFFELGMGQRRGPGHPFAAAVNRALAPKGSRFFGEVDGLTSLITHLLPALIPSRRYSQTLRLWSAGCGTGQQTYSLAIAFAELCPGLATWNLEIVASDRDAWAVDRGRKGIYSPTEVQCGLPTEWLIRHFEPLSAGDGWRCKAPLAERLRWLQLDLAQSCAAVGAADIVVCHQKLGELELPTRRQCLSRLTDQLAADGFLILRSPDATLEDGAEFERVQAGAPTVYRRADREISLLTA